MMIEWQYPIHLTHLNITDCHILNDWNIIYSLINNIWSLPKLTHCHLDINVIDENYSFVPTVISSTLEYLSIKNIHCNFKELVHLFEYTPRLRYLDITINQKGIDHSYLSFSIPLITTLKLIYEGPFSVLTNLLQGVPDLRHWTMRTKGIRITGKQWEDIISNHMPKLKVFHFLMEFNFYYSHFLLGELVSTYTSDFWLNEHKWYIQGHHYLCEFRETNFLYTLPYAFNDYYIPFNDTHFSRSESHFSNFNDQILYDHIHRLFCISSSTSIYNQFCTRFSHIHHLVLKLPFNDNFWTCIPTFDQLRILDIFLSYKEAYNKVASSELQTLFDRAPKLYSLTFKSSISSLLPLLECTSESIVKLNFENCDEYFNYSNCATLFLSSLGKQCKILSIKVDDRMNILQLVKEMSELRTLNVQHPPNKYKIDSSLSNNDKLIKWLQHELPSTCTATRDSIYPDNIRIWIR
jgi:hypothetical protein